MKIERQSFPDMYVIKLIIHHENVYHQIRFCLFWDTPQFNDSIYISSFFKFVLFADDTNIVSSHDNDFDFPCI